MEDDHHRVDDIDSCSEDKEDKNYDSDDSINNGSDQGTLENPDSSTYDPENEILCPWGSRC